MLFVFVAEAVVEEDEGDDEGAHAGAVEVEFVLHYYQILYIRSLFLRTYKSGCAGRGVGGIGAIVSGFADIITVSLNGERVEQRGGGGRSA